MILALCGFMGAGKSTLGRKAAQKAGCRFIDLDEYIEDRRGMGIPVFFSRYGEAAFRKEETESLAEIVEEYRYLNAKGPYDLVLALGGGTVTHAPSAAIVAADTLCVYLRCSRELLVSRLLKNSHRRPLLSGKSPQEIAEVVGRLMQEREPVYLACADVVQEIDGKRLSEQISALSGLLEGSFPK